MRELKELAYRLWLNLEFESTLEERAVALQEILETIDGANESNLKSLLTKTLKEIEERHLKDE